MSSPQGEVAETAVSSNGTSTEFDLLISPLNGGQRMLELRDELCMFSWS